MTQEEFGKKRFKGFEPIIFEGVKGEKNIECILLAVDFEQELFKLEPLDKNFYEDKEFWCRIEYCNRPHYKLKKST